MIEGAQPGDKLPINILHDILNGRGSKYIECVYPLKLEAAMRLLGLALPYTAARLQSITVTDGDAEAEQRVEFIRRVHDEAMARNEHAAKHGREVAGIIDKLPEDEAAVLRNAIGTGIVINGYAE